MKWWWLKWSLQTQATNGEQFCKKMQRFFLLSIYLIVGGTFVGVWQCIVAYRWFRVSNISLKYEFGATQTPAIHREDRRLANSTIDTFPVYSMEVGFRMGFEYVVRERSLNHTFFLKCSWTQSEHTKAESQCKMIKWTERKQGYIRLEHKSTNIRATLLLEMASFRCGPSIF